MQTAGPSGLSPAALDAAVLRHALGHDEADRLSIAVETFFASPVASRLAEADRVERETPMRVTVGSTVLVGTVDAVAWRGDAALVLDYKTGRAPLDDSDPRISGYELQARCYALAVLEAGAASVEAAFCFVEHEARVRHFDFTARDMPAIRADLQERIDRIVPGPRQPPSHVRSGCLQSVPCAWWSLPGRSALGSRSCAGVRTVPLAETAASDKGRRRTLIVDDIMVARQGSWVELSARVRRDGARRPFRLWYRFPVRYRRTLRSDGSAFLAALMMPSMALGEPLRVEAPVSGQLLRQSESLMRIFHGWWPELEVIPIEAPRRRRMSRPPRRRAAAFFTLGVDSFYTLLKNADGGVWGTPPIGSLIFVVGFDVKARKKQLLAQIEGNLQRVATATGTEVLEVETNLRELSDGIVSWNQYHGSALASVAIALERAFEAIYTASSGSFDDPFPWGSHPLTDPLWATESMRYIHDGTERRRADKITSIASVPIVQATLRSCWENRGNRYNCGECEKCLRTMGALFGVDALEATETFPDSYPLDALERIDWTPRVRTRFGHVLDVLPDDARCRPLREAILSHAGPLEKQDSAEDASGSDE